MAEVTVLSMVIMCLQLVVRIFTTLEQAYDFSQEFKSIPGAIRNLILDVQAAQGYLQNIQLRVQRNTLTENSHNQDNHTLVNNFEGAQLSLQIISAFATKHAASIQSWKLPRYLIYMIQHAEIMKYRDELRNRLVYLRMLQDSRFNAPSDDNTSSNRTSSDPGSLPPQASAIGNNRLIGELPLPPLLPCPHPSKYSRWASRDVSRKLVENARRGGVEETRRLLAAGADVDYQSRAAEPKLEGKTALHKAAEMGHTALVRELLRSGAKPNLRTTGPSNDTALHLAAKNGHIAVLQQLLNINTVEVDANDGEGFSPLQRCEDQAAMGTLLKAGADPTRKLASSNNTVLHWAASMGQLRLVRQVLALEGIEIDDENAEGLTPLLKSKSERILIAIVEAGADPMRQFPGSRDTVLHHAAASGWTNAVRQLAGMNAVDVQARNKFGFTPLEMATLARNRGEYGPHIFEDIAEALNQGGVYA